METEQFLLEQICQNTKVHPYIAIINTVIRGNDAQFIIYQIIPCSPDIYCVFVDSETQQLYALQNVGSQCWGKLSTGVEEDIYFLLPITSYMVRSREDCLATFYKWCRESELGTIPIIKEEFINPFI